MKILSTIKVSLPKLRIPMAPPSRFHQDKRTKRSGNRSQQRDRAIREGC